MKRTNIEFPMSPQSATVLINKLLNYVRQNIKLNKGTPTDYHEYNKKIWNPAVKRINNLLVILGYGASYFWTNWRNKKPVKIDNNFY